jgi:N-acetylglucosaminyldiphosphoundecaprenol N-acetyl-beta-D-mannosaminyltransferase
MTPDTLEIQTRKTTRVEVMGIEIDNLSMEETLSLIEAKILEGDPVQHVVVNAAKVVEVNKNPQLKAIIESCEIVNADGQAVVWASKILGTPLKERVAGIDLMQALVQRSSQKGWSIYFFGAKQDVLDKVVARYQKEFPTLRIAGARNGYYTPEEESAIATEISKSGAHILFVAISSPKKEIFLNKYLNVMNVPFVMGVGGSFDVVAGLTKRAPQWMQKIGLEWLFRFLQEPRRMWRRYIIGNAEFIALLLEYKFKRR